MTDEIRPALTPEEWAKHEVDGLELVNGKLWDTADGQPLDNPFGLMALANAALPDDDPRKITRRDLRALDVEISVHDYELQALRAKLAALLPPDE